MSLHILVMKLMFGIMSTGVSSQLLQYYCLLGFETLDDNARHGQTCLHYGCARDTH